MTGWAALIITYSIVLLPLVILAVLATRRLMKRRRGRDTIEGIAASCLVAICAGMLLTRGIGVQPGILSWGLFAIICGLLIAPPEPLKLQDAATYAIIPALALLGTLLAIYFIPYWLSDAFGAVMSSTSTKAPIAPGRALSFTLFGSIASIPAITVAIIARSRIVVLLKWLYNADVKRIGAIEKLVNTIIRIGISVAALLAVAH
jgi:hypothetical protein